MLDPGIREATERVKKAGEFLPVLLAEIRKTIVGQDPMVEALLVGLLARGHVLLEGVPGLAKTLAVKTLAAAIRVGFKRIQFTPDLLPADLTGTMVFDQRDGSFTPRKGPLFTNLVLADEVNRAPAKVQSALLEAMEERQITIGDRTYLLDEPFLVLATQNPIEQEGTYPLPEAQIDRFMLKLVVEYPDKREERQILDRMASFETQAQAEVRGVVEPAEILAARQAVDAIYVDDRIKDYVVDLVHATRKPKDYGLDTADLVQYGASPRATIYLTRAAKAHAFLRARGFVTPEDVKAVGLEVLRHRIILTYEAEAEEVTSDVVIRRVFDKVEVP